MTKYEKRIMRMICEKHSQMYNIPLAANFDDFERKYERGNFSNTFETVCKKYLSEKRVKIMRMLYDECDSIQYVANVYEKNTDTIYSVLLDSITKLASYIPFKELLVGSLKYNNIMENNLRIISEITEPPPHIVPQEKNSSVVYVSDLKLNTRAKNSIHRTFQKPLTTITIQEFLRMKPSDLIFCGIETKKHICKILKAENLLTPEWKTAVTEINMKKKRKRK